MSPLGSGRVKQKGPFLTVGGSQLDHVRHFVGLWQDAVLLEEREEEQREGHRLTPLLHIHTEATENDPKQGADPGDKDFMCPLTVARWSVRRSVGRSVGAGLWRGSVRSDAGVKMQGVCAEEPVMRLDKDGV